MDTDSKIYHKKRLEDTFLSYAKGLYIYAKEFVDRPEIAEDILHDVFVKFWEKSENLEDTNIKSYLFRSTKNQCLNYLTNSKMKSDHNDRILKEKLELIHELDFFLDADIHKMITDALSTLPPQQRKVFILNKIEGMRTANIALALNISPRTVEKHIQLATKTLRENLSHSAFVSLMIWIMIMHMFK